METKLIRFDSRRCDVEFSKRDGNMDTATKASEDPIFFIGLKVQGMVACKLK
jgi:hypothetical protein